MNHTDEELARLFDEAFADEAPGAGVWDATRAAVRRRARRRQALAGAAAAVVAAAMIALPAVLLPRERTAVEFSDQPSPTVVPTPTFTDKPADVIPRATAPTAAPTSTPTPTSPPPPVTEPAPAPARVEIRDHRVVLLDANGNVARVLYGDYDPAVHGPEYGIGDLAVRPGSTDRDLAVAFVDGYLARTLSVVVVSGGGEPQVHRGLGVADHDAFGNDQPMAEPAPAWSPDGAVLAWLQPDPANRAVLHAVAWAADGPAGPATPAGGIPIDRDGLMLADETRGLALTGWGAGGLLAARAYRPLEDGAERRYTIPVTRNGDRIDAQPLVRE